MATNPPEAQNSAQIGETIEALERKINLLKIEYEQYFLGLIKKEPADLRAEITKVMRGLATQRITNTAHNFRYQQLKARFSTLSLYWTRTLKQIEEGTFRRDQFRLKVRVREEEERKQMEARKAEEARKADEAKRAEEARKSQTSRPTRDTVTDQDALKKLYTDFVHMRQRCNERVDNVQFDKMVEFMQQQTRAIKDRYGVKAVQFQVVEDSGKTKLKAIPIKDDSNAR